MLKLKLIHIRGLPWTLVDWKFAISVTYIWTVASYRCHVVSNQQQLDCLLKWLSWLITNISQSCVDSHLWWESTGKYCWGKWFGVLTTPRRQDGMPYDVYSRSIRTTIYAIIYQAHRCAMEILQSCTKPSALRPVIVPFNISVSRHIRC